jgi:glycosyltransferase involved in cell wall biosynthesis
MRTIWNGISGQGFAPAATANGRPTLGWVGRIDPLKDVKGLIRAMARVHQDEPNAELLLAGIVPADRERYHQECLALCSELGLEDAIRFLGSVSDVADVYNRSDVVVLSSMSEAFPYTVIEAMMCGRPVVATAVGGVAEAVGNAGILVDPGDPDQLAAACLRLLQSPEMREELGRLARERALGQFTDEKCTTQYRETYRWLRQLVWRPPGAPSSPFVSVGEAKDGDQQQGAGGTPPESVAVGSSSAASR